METYTHNLKIIMVDSDENIVLDNEILDEIKNALCQSNTKQIQWNGKKIDIILQWHRKELNKIQQQFMGDLFANPMYDSDSIIVNHASQVISSVKHKHNCDIKFYISRVIGDKTICKDSGGIVY
jgi:hypothetical protein